MLSAFIAMAPAPRQPGGQSPGLLTMMLPWILMIVVLWLLILRPQAKRQKEHQKMLNALEKGDRIVTTGGVHGEVVRVNDKEGTLVVKISDNTRITLEKGAVARKLPSGGSEVGE